jgi:hypothetical protein
MGDGIRDVTVRVHEWTAWIPLRGDRNDPDLLPANGVTSFRALEGERLVDLQAETTGIKMLANLSDDDEDDTQDVDGKSTEDEKGVPHALYTFRAVLAANQSDLGVDLEEIVSPQPTPEESKEQVKAFREEIIARRQAQAQVLSGAQGIPKGIRGGGPAGRPKR